MISFEIEPGKSVVNMTIFAGIKIWIMESVIFLILVAITAPINSFPSGSGKKVTYGL